MSQNNHNNPENASFSFSGNYDLGNEEITVEKITTIVQEVLDERFSDPEKRRINEADDSLRFACPVCGDSQKNNRKKRGNIFFDSSQFHCFNCYRHYSFENFCKHFGKGNYLSPSERASLRKKRDAQVQRQVDLKRSFNVNVFLDESLIDEVAVERSFFIDKLGLSEIKGSTIETYVRKRLQQNWNRFAYDEKHHNLFLFNLTADNKRIIGLQIRTFKSKSSGSKYLTYKLSKIYSEFLKQEISEDKQEKVDLVDHFSHAFGVLSLDIHKPITLFEGPMDSFLLKNAVGLCSSGNDLPFDVSNKRWMYDYDTTGKKKSIEKLQKGETVFLWGKYLKDCGIPWPSNKKLDFNDLLILSKRKKLGLKKIGSYFSNSKHDIIYI